MNITQYFSPGFWSPGEVREGEGSLIMPPPKAHSAPTTPMITRRWSRITRSSSCHSRNALSLSLSQSDCSQQQQQQLSLMLCWLTLGRLLATTGGWRSWGLVGPRHRSLPARQLTLEQRVGNPKISRSRNSLTSRSNFPAPAQPWKHRATNSPKRERDKHNFGQNKNTDTIADLDTDI